MSYIGRTPQIGAYHKLDSITCDGSTAYTMQLDSANFVPESVNHLIVSVNGVIQAPTDSFTVSSSTITFASALSSSDTIDFIMALGNVLDIGTPSDSTVSLSKLTATGTKDATTFLRGDNTFAVPAGGTNTPNFDVRLSSNFGLTNDTFVKVTWDSETFDSDNAFASNKFTVPSGKAGKYLFMAHYKIGNSLGYYTFKYYKNGSAVSGMDRNIYNHANTDNDFSFHHNAILDLSVGDYIETYVQTTSGSGNNVSSNQSYWQGFKLI
jgi:hypothetical protein